MTVQELINELIKHERDKKVVFVSIDGDIPCVESYTLDDVVDEHGFVQLRSID